MVEVDEHLVAAMFGGQPSSAGELVVEEEENMEETAEGTLGMHAHTHTQRHHTCTHTHHHHPTQSTCMYKIILYTT